MTDPIRVEKPWGYEEIWARTSLYVGKILFIRAGHRLSLQHHEHKDESIRVASGELDLTMDDGQGELVTVRLGPGQAARIPPRVRHRMKALVDTEVLEVSSPHLDDIVRHTDDYGRT